MGPTLRVDKVAYPPASYRLDLDRRRCVPHTFGCLGLIAGGYVSDDAPLRLTVKDLGGSANTRLVYALRGRERRGRHGELRGYLRCSAAMHHPPHSICSTFRSGYF
ncbi:hypothetical protein PQX77_010310 [Marasmius sp. AFHP31]|nr:hypothetical protein PQX77_010310 [Marasmius sp. AFHP31]